MKYRLALVALAALVQLVPAGKLRNAEDSLLPVEEVMDDVLSVFVNADETNKEVAKKASDEDSDETKTDADEGHTGGKIDKKENDDAEEKEEAGDKEEGEGQREDEEQDKLKKRRKQEQAKADAKAKESRDVSYDSWGEFLPTCRKQLKNLVLQNERLYAPPQLTPVLLHECELDKEFPTVRERFFDRKKECKDFVQQLVQARADERLGKPNPYDKCCARQFDEYMSNNPNHHGKFYFWLYVLLGILAFVLVGATVARHMA